MSRDELKKLEIELTMVIDGVALINLLAVLQFAEENHPIEGPRGYAGMFLNMLEERFTDELDAMKEELGND